MLNNGKAGKKGSKWPEIGYLRNPASRELQKK
jgi:hypothetical protein